MQVTIWPSDHFCIAQNFDDGKVWQMASHPSSEASEGIHDWSGQNKLWALFNQIRGQLRINYIYVYIYKLLRIYLSYLSQYDLIISLLVLKITSALCLLLLLYAQCYTLWVYAWVVDAFSPLDILIDIAVVE